jgi:hypothetical protein
MGTVKSVLIHSFLRRIIAMAKRILLSNLRERLADAIANEQDFIDRLSPETNPQTVDMVREAKARKDAFEAVQLALNGGGESLLNIYAAKRSQ